MTNLALQEKFIEDQEFRNQYITKTEVMNKAKLLTLLPDNEHMVSKMVSEYFEVEDVTVRQIISRHYDELIIDGLKIVKGEELKQVKRHCYTM